MKIGDLIRVQHFGTNHNGKVGILMSVRTSFGSICYSVHIPSLTYEIHLSIEQCEVIHEDR